MPVNGWRAWSMIFAATALPPAALAEAAARAARAALGEEVLADGLAADRGASAVTMALLPPGSTPPYRGTDETLICVYPPHNGLALLELVGNANLMAMDMDRPPHESDLAPADPARIARELPHAALCASLSELLGCDLALLCSSHKHSETTGLWLFGAGRLLAHYYLSSVDLSIHDLILADPAGALNTALGGRFAFLRALPPKEAYDDDEALLPPPFYGGHFDGDDALIEAGILDAAAPHLPWNVPGLDPAAVITVDLAATRRRLLAAPPAISSPAAGQPIRHGQPLALAAAPLPDADWFCWHLVRDGAQLAKIGTQLPELLLAPDSPDYPAPGPLAIEVHARYGADWTPLAAVEVALLPAE
ncbi:MAG TPA: hypothetical protein VGE07_21170 [Herpetosiphonaceae bacterium]